MKIRNRKVLLIILFCIILIIELIAIPKEVKAATYTQTLKQGIENFPIEYQTHLNELKEMYPNWNFTAYYTGLTWNEFMQGENTTHYTNSVIKTANDLWKCECGTLKSGYVCASKAITAYYADPRNFLGESTVFQFLEMSYNENIHNEAGVAGIIMDSFMNTNVTFNLNGTETTMSYARIIIEAAKQSGISPYSIAIKIIQEVGYEGSSSVSGTYIAPNGTNYSGYYNFFNYGAYDSGNAIENALIYAKDREWNNQYTAIVEGAKLMANSYINVGQNTAYFYKWDVVGNELSQFFNHQYMTNVQDPTSQSSTLFNTYAKNNLLPAPLNFIIPVYDDMPNVNNLPSVIDTSLSTSYYLTGSDVRLRATPSTSASILATLDRNEVVTLLEWNTAYANGYDWSKIRLANGTEGYIASKYLAQCNPTNNDTTIQPVECAKIEGDNIKALPNCTIESIANSLNIPGYEVYKGETIISSAENIGTGYIFKDKINNKDYTVIVSGDVNGDGKMTPADSTVILRSYVGLNQTSDAANKAADLNKDGKLTPADSTVVLRAYVGLQNITL